MGSTYKQRMRYVATAAAFLVVIATILLWRAYLRGPENIKAAVLPEEIIYARAKDNILNGGVIFTPPKSMAKPIAVIWIHGWGVNFYAPEYVVIGRALAGHGYTCIAANTRMHDLGNIEGYKGEQRIRGGGYWGVESEEVLDVAAWIDLAEEHGFSKVVLVGHSAGWAAVRSYQAETQDKRVAGIVLASGAVRAETRPTDTAQLRQALQMMAAGRGDDLIRDPKRSFPSFVSAATFMDIMNTPPELRDFFGALHTTNPGITRIQCPLLAFFGTNGDVGDAAELETLKTNIRRQPKHHGKVSTAMIKNADHMYQGQETQVADTIANWINTQIIP